MTGFLALGQLRHLPLRAWGVLAALAPFSVHLLTAPAEARQPQAEGRQFDIPAQPVAEALVQFCLGAGCSFALMDDSGGVQSTAVRGFYREDDALALLLSGTGMTFRRAGRDTIRIFAAPTPEAAETVVVQGRYSETMRSSLAVKRDADQIVDAATAAQIGELPAANIAEAMQRIPGVAISREAGEGQFVSVRGLGPLFQSVTLNGAPIAFNENIRNSDQSGRQFQFRVVPPDLVSGIVVAKSPTADMIDGGVGSNIDIRIARPFETQPFVSARAFAHNDDRTGNVRANGALLGVRRAEDGRLGLAGGISYQARDVQFDRLQHFGYTDHVIGGASVSVPNDVVLTMEREERERISAFGGVQWRPSETMLFSFDTLYSEFRNRIAEHRISFEWGGRTDFASLLFPGSAVVRDGVLVAGEAHGGRINRNAEFSEQLHANLLAQFGLDWSAGDWKVSPSLSWSRAASVLTTPLQRIDGQTALNAVNYSFDYGDDPVGDKRVASVLTGADLGGPRATGVFRYRVRPTESEDEDLTARLNVRRDLDLVAGGLHIDAVGSGAQLTARTRDYQRRDRILTPRGANAFDPQAATRFAVPDNAFDRTIGQRFPAWTSYDQAAFASGFYLPGEYDGAAPRVSDLAPSGEDRQQSYRVEEEIAALYLQAEFSGDLLGHRYDGNAGLRWTGTHTAVSGAQLALRTALGGAASATAERLEISASYAEPLPTLNLRLHLAPDMALRFAAYSAITRPSLADLRVATVPNSSLLTDIYERGQQAVLDTTPSSRVAVGGNPGLRPYVAANLDMSLEWRANDFGGASIGLFHKDIDDFVSVIGQTEQLVFNTRAGPAIPVDIIVSRPRNIGRARVSGVELNASGKTVWGLGVDASATFTNSSGQIATATVAQSVRLQGVSDAVYSFRPFYERGPFEAQLVYTWRSAVVTNGNVTPTSNASPDPDTAVIADDFGSLDGSASLRLAIGLEVFFEATNILDDRQAVYLGDKRRLFQLHEFGRTFNIGFRRRI